MKSSMKMLITILLSGLVASAETAIEPGEMAHVVTGRGSGAESIGAVALVLSCGSADCEVTYNYTPQSDGTAKAKPGFRKSTIKKNNLLRAVPLGVLAEVAALVEQSIQTGSYSGLSAELKQSWHYSADMTQWIVEKNSRNGMGQSALTFNCKDYGWAPTDSCRLKIAQSYVTLVHKNLHCVSNYRSWGVYITTVLETPTRDGAGLVMYQQQSAGRYDMNPIETARVIELSGDAEITTNVVAQKAYGEGQCEHLD